MPRPEATTSDLIHWDKRHFWHPFTPMEAWTAPNHEPLLIIRGEGAWLEDAQGRRYLDGNSSIWTNIHGHSHPRLVEAIQNQAATLAHASTLGFTNAPAARLARALVSAFPENTLTKVFFSDDGSTAVECALRMALQFWEMTDDGKRQTFVAFDRAYHGDTLGAASLGGIPTFHQRVARLGLPVIHVPDMSALHQLDPGTAAKIAGVIIEPLIQGAAGMKPWPAGMLTELRAWCDRHHTFLILDEVMTGFGRTGTLFACQQENVTPDFLALAKGLTGGTLPLAATLTTERIYQAFLNGSDGQERTFYYGHSYCGNPLGCAVALASLQLFQEEKTLETLPPKIARLRSLLKQWRTEDPRVLDTRQCGLIAGIEIGSREGRALPPKNRTGAAICLAAREHGLLTRPIGDTLVFMPPLCVTLDELDHGIHALRKAVAQESNGPN